MYYVCIFHGTMNYDYHGKCTVYYVVTMIKSCLIKGAFIIRDQCYGAIPMTIT